MTKEPIDRGESPVEDVGNSTGQFPQSSIERIHWSELYKSGKFYGTTNSAMLRSDYIVKKECRIDGQSHLNDKATREVIYDKDFIVNQLAVGNKFILTDCTLEEWLDVCHAAYGKFNELEETTIVNPIPKPSSTSTQDRELM